MTGTRWSPTWIEEKYYAPGVGVVLETHVRGEGRRRAGRRRRGALTRTMTGAVRVLVVEDEVRLADGIRKGLEAEGFAVDVAHDGTDGLWRAREHDYDAIVLDIMLPGLNGFRVCAALRDAGTGRRSSCSRPRTATSTRPRRSTPAPTTT